VADPGVGTRGGSIDLLTALDLLGKAEQSRDTWRRIAEQRKGAELQASFWKSRYDVQHGTVHRLEDAVAAAEARVAELEAERAGYATILHDVLLSAPADVQRAGLERIAALAAVRQEKP
jgi:hypothetical protein